MILQTILQKGWIMSELIFLVENAEEGGFVARALGEPIFTQAEDLEDLRLQIRDAVLCHFDDDTRPRLVRLHFAHDEVMAV